MMVAVDESGRRLVRITLLGGFTGSVDDEPSSRDLWDSQSFGHDVGRAMAYFGYLEN